MFSTTLPSPLGELTVVARSLADEIRPTASGVDVGTADRLGIAGIYFEDHSKPPNPAYFGDWVAPDSHPLFLDLSAQLAAYFRSELTQFELPLAPRGDDFQLQVWKIISTIPFGETTSYGAIATQLGNRHLAQAVGGAVGKNPISIVVPCHRVVGSTGALTGFAGGIPRKRYLLELEEPESESSARLF
jgi:methylated-DNA-[protein]-cysteine S-methyltransferase